MKTFSSAKKSLFVLLCLPPALPTLWDLTEILLLKPHIPAWDLHPNFSPNTSKLVKQRCSALTLQTLHIPHEIHLCSQTLLPHAGVNYHFGESTRPNGKMTGNTEIKNMHAPFTLERPLQRDSTGSRYKDVHESIICKDKHGNYPWEGQSSLTTTERTMLGHCLKLLCDRWRFRKTHIKIITVFISKKGIGLVER